jgi:NAD(P)-dependent dehydrogenase (short-subunit alcohol dehydrogenase family)
VPSALVVGASTGIGLAIARRLVAAGWTVTGMARRPSPLVDEGYRHVIADVCAPGYRDAVAAVGAVELCIYAAGIGKELALDDLSHEADVFATNLVGVAITAQVVLPAMLAAGAGHFVGLSSQADELTDAFAPAYNASKSGMSRYLEGLALKCRPRGVAITNVRFGFVDTAMSSPATPRPFMITAERAAELLERAIARRPIRYTYPRRLAVLLALLQAARRVRIWLS